MHSLLDALNTPNSLEKSFLKSFLIGPENLVEKSEKHLKKKREERTFSISTRRDPIRKSVSISKQWLRMNNYHLYEFSNSLRLLFLTIGV